MTSPTISTAGDVALPELVRELGAFQHARTRLLNLAREHPDAVLSYLKTVPLDFSEIPGGELLRDLETMANGTLDEAAAESHGSARH